MLFHQTQVLASLSRRLFQKPRGYNLNKARYKAFFCAAKFLAAEKFTFSRIHATQMFWFEVKIAVKIKLSLIRQNGLKIKFYTAKYKLTIGVPEGTLYSYISGLNHSQQIPHFMTSKFYIKTRNSALSVKFNFKTSSDIITLYKMSQDID